MNYAGRLFRHNTRNEYIAITEDKGLENFLSAVVVDIGKQSICNDRFYIRCLEEGRNKEYEEVSLEEFMKAYIEVRHITELNIYKVLKVNKE